MSHTNLLLPHPIIKPGGFDYNENCHFNMEIKQAMTLDGNIHVEMSYDLASSTINDLIKKEKARFFITLKCVKTHQRITRSSIDTFMIWDIPISDCVDKINITPYVATTEEISSFHSKEHDDEIQQMIPNGVDLPAGAILAVGKSHEITIDSIEKIQAAIKIIQNKELEMRTYAINTNSDYLNIEMHPNTQNSIRNIHNKSVELLYPSIYLAAIEQAIRDMEECKDRKWAQALHKTLVKHNIEINYEKLQEEANKHAQTILNKPLDRIIQWHNREDEYD